MHRWIALAWNCAKARLRASAVHHVTRVHGAIFMSNVKLAIVYYST